MVVFEIFITFLSIAFLLLIVGLWRKNYLLTILSGVLFISIAGIVFIGIEYKSGNYISNVYNGSMVSYVNSTNTYTTITNEYFVLPFTSLFLLFGLYLIVVSWIKLFFKRALGVNIYLGDDGLDEGEDSDK